MILDHTTSLTHRCFFRRPTRKIMIPLQVWHPKEQAARVNLMATCCRSSFPVMLHSNFREFFFRDCPKRSRKGLRRGLTGCQTVLFGPFSPLHTGQIQGWSVARTLFGQFRKLNSRKSGCRILHSRGPKQPKLPTVTVEHQTLNPISCGVA